MLIRDGIIEEVGTTRRVENLVAARTAAEIDATGRVVMPGFVDSQTDLVYGPPWLTDFELRIAGSDTGAGATGFHSSGHAVRTLSFKGLEARAQRMVSAMVRHGTTTFESRSGHGIDASGEFKILRVLGRLNRRPLDVVATFLVAAGGVEHNSTLLEARKPLLQEMLPLVRHRRLASFADVRCDRRGFDLEETARLLETARSLGFLLKVQANEFAHAGAVPLAVRMGAVSVQHLEQISAVDIAVLAGSPAIATLLPGSAFHLGSGRRAPARALIDAGAAVALASDFNPHTSPSCNMQFILSLACIHLKMTPGEAISAGTINGAHALRRAHAVGSLEHGKFADLIVMNASDYREVPYHCGMNSVHLTMKRGAVIYREGQVESP
jgi:imidazolonepropionase